MMAPAMTIGSWFAMGKPGIIGAEANTHGYFMLTRSAARQQESREICAREEEQ
jgi:hypothetical protein